MILVLPLAGLAALSAVVPALVRRYGRDTGYLVAGVMLAALAALATTTPRALGDDPVTVAAPWLPSIDVAVALRLDALALVFATIVLGIGAVVLAYAARYLDLDGPSTGRMLALLTFFAASMLGLVLADDVIVLFAFWELTSVSSYLLIGGRGEGGPAAMRALLVTSLGGLALLAGLLLLSIDAQTSSITTILADPDVVAGSELAPAIIVLLIVGAATKSAQLPVQFWLPGAMVAPTPVSTYLHAATMVKAGIYLLLRFSAVFAAVPLWRTTLVLLGLATAVFGAAVALTKHDGKALLAYSTVSQLGFIVGMIGIGTPLALAAAVLHTLAHAVFKAALFMSVGVIDHATGTRDLRRLGGLRRQLPLTATAGGLAAASMAGLPPLIGFVSKEEAFAAFAGAAGSAGAAGATAGDVAAQPTGAGWLAIVAVVLAVTASIGTFAYTARWYLGVFEGPSVTTAHRPVPAFEVPALVLGALGLLLGIAVPLLDPLINAAARVAGGTDPGLHLALWHGPTVPLLLSLVVVGVGGLLVVGRARVAAWQAHVSTPVGDAVFDAAYRRSLAVGRWFGLPAASLSPAAYLLPILAVLLIGAAGVVGWGELPPTGDAAGSRSADWAIVVLLAACIVAVIQARSRLAAVTALGLAGFIVAGWFVLLGAPDLALTQLLVETLNVVVIVVVFRRLPETFSRGGMRRKTLAAVVAVAVGVLAAAAAYTLTGRRPLTGLGRRFLIEGESVTGGTNVVNTILVDFRALDTLGETTVLAAATLGIYALVRLVRHQPLSRPEPTVPTAATVSTRATAPMAPTETTLPNEPDDHRDLQRRGDPDVHVVHVDLWHGPGTIESIVLQTLANGLGAVMVAASLWLLVRGHDAVGGGFIGGLTAGAAVVLFYLSHGHERVWQSRWLRITPLIGAGLLISAGYGIAGLVFGSGFLAGGKLVLPGGEAVAASLVFDIGVYLVVVAMIVAIVRHLGQGLVEDAAHPARATPTGRVAPSTAAARTDRDTPAGRTRPDADRQEQP